MKRGTASPFDKPRSYLGTTTPKTTSITLNGLTPIVTVIGVNSSKPVPIEKLVNNSAN